jgi:hypothetical protein
MPLSAQKTAPPAWLHSPVAAHWPPSPIVPPEPSPLEQAPLMHASPPQQTMSRSHEPPALWQQLSVPSESMPLEAQTAAPPAWLHWPVCVQVAPSARPPVVLLVQTLLTQ